MSQPKRKEETLGKEMNGAEAIAVILQKLGIDKVFCDSEINPLIREKLKEQAIKIEEGIDSLAAAYQAITFSLITNKPAVLLLIPGKKAIEAIPAVTQAFIDSIPLLIISSIRSYRDPSKGRIGELRNSENQMEMFEQVTKFSERSTSIEELSPTLEKALKEAMSNRPRPAYVEIPEEILKLKAYPLALSGQKVEKRLPDKNTIAKISELLINSTSPVIIAGRGITLSGANKELMELAELIDAPVVTTIKGKGAFPASHKLYLGTGTGIIGGPIVSEIIEKADVILALGTRLSQLSTGGYTMKYKGLLIHNSIDGEDIGKTFMPQIAVVGDVYFLLKELIAILRTKIKDKRASESTRKIKDLKIMDKRFENVKGFWPIKVVEAISAFSRDFNFAVDITATTLDSIYLPIDNPSQWITSTGFPVSGFSINALFQMNKVIAITDARGVLRNLDKIYALNRMKGERIIIVIDDGGVSYLDYSIKELPEIVKRGEIVNVEQIIKHTEVKTYIALSQKELSEQLMEAKSFERLSVIDVKVDQEFVPISIMRF